MDFASCLPCSICEVFSDCFAIDEALDNPVKKVTATMASYVQEIHYSTILTPKIAD